jgi:molybdopterin synthase sulfur carrier subunit
MNATVNLPTILRQHTGGAKKVEASGSTVGEVFRSLGAEYPKLAEQLTDPNGNLPVFVNVFLDDEDIRYLDGLETSVDSGADITILPAVAGGSR